HPVADSGIVRVGGDVCRRYAVWYGYLSRYMASLADNGWNIQFFPGDHDLVVRRHAHTAGSTKQYEIADRLDLCSELGVIDFQVYRFDEDDHRCAYHQYADGYYLSNL